jgi:hypothetical protein
MNFRFLLFSLVATPVLALQAASPFSGTFSRAQGGKWQFPAPGECRAVALIFAGHECPISNGFVPEVARLAQEFESQGVKFCVVYAERDLSLEEAKKHAREFAYPCPAVIDPKQQLARAAKATVTPEAALISPEGKVLYLGRIDDRYAAYTKKRPQPKTRDLRNAILDVLAGRKVAVPYTQTIGCYIDFGSK